MRQIRKIASRVTGKSGTFSNKKNKNDEASSSSSNLCINDNVNNHNNDDGPTICTTDSDSILQPSLLQTPQQVLTSSQRVIVENSPLLQPSSFNKIQQQQKCKNFDTTVTTLSSNEKSTTNDTKKTIALESTNRTRIFLLGLVLGGLITLFGITTISGRGSSSSKIDRLDDRIAIQQVIKKYEIAMKERNYNLLRSIYTDDGIIDNGYHKGDINETINFLVDSKNDTSKHIITSSSYFVTSHGNSILDDITLFDHNINDETCSATGSNSGTSSSSSSMSQEEKSNHNIIKEEKKVGKNDNMVTHCNSNNYDAQLDGYYFNPMVPTSIMDSSSSRFLSFLFVRDTYSHKLIKKGKNKWLIKYTKEDGSGGGSNGNNVKLVLFFIIIQCIIMIYFTFRVFDFILNISSRRQRRNIQQ